MLAGEDGAAKVAVQAGEVNPLLTGPAPTRPSADYCEKPLGKPSDLIVGIVGPTASGKSDLSLDVAESLPQMLGAKGAEVIQTVENTDLETTICWEIVIHYLYSM